MILGKILAEEINSPNTASRSLIHILSILQTKEKQKVSIFFKRSYKRRCYEAIKEDVIKEDVSGFTGMAPDCDMSAKS